MLSLVMQDSAWFLSLRLLVANQRLAWATAVTRLSTQQLSSVTPDLAWSVGEAVGVTAATTKVAERSRPD